MRPRTHARGLVTSHEVACTLTAREYKGALPEADLSSGVAHALRGEGFDASEDGTGRWTPIVPVQVAPTLRAGGNSTGGARPYGTDADTCDSLIAVAIQERAIAENASAGPDGKGWRDDGAAYTLEARQVPQAVDFAQNQRDEVRTMDVAGALAAEPGAKQQTYLAQPYSIMPMNSGKDYKARPTDVAQPVMAGGPVGGNQGGDYIAEQWAVRRLTPTECERLQGFPDGYTDIGNGRGGDTPDGPRYKALGNSMAVNVMRWIGRRIEMVEAI